MKIKMKHFIVIITLLLINMTCFSQKEKKYIREGNKHFDKGKYENSEVSYRKALEEESQAFNALFNLGDAMYKQEKYEDAAGEFNGVSQMNTDKINRARTFHNLGNSLLKANKIQESIEAFNLAYAQDLLDQQQQQQQNQNKEQQEKDQNKDNQKQQESQEQEQNQEQQNREEQQQQQPQPDQISKEDAKRLLEALADDERKIQEKIKKAKAKQNKVRTTKEW
jgi:Ca-activated chloride channel family protein